MVGVVAKLRVQDGKGADFEAAAKDMIAAVKANEAGKTLVYSLHKSQADPNLYVFYELYAAPEALAAHGTTDHMKAFGGKIGGLLAGAPEIERLDVVASL